jgi:hypothetical protein
MLILIPRVDAGLDLHSCDAKTVLRKQRIKLLQLCYVGHCPLSEIHFLRRTFRELAPLPSSDNLMSLSLYCMTTSEMSCTLQTVVSSQRNVSVMNRPLSLSFAVSLSTRKLFKEIMF